MGLISGLLLLPLAPVRGTAWVADLLLDTAERELYGSDALRAQLAALNHAYEAGDLDEVQFEAEEDRLLDLLEQTQEKAKAGHGSGRETRNG